MKRHLHLLILCVLFLSVRSQAQQTPDSAAPKTPAPVTAPLAAASIVSDMERWAEQRQAIFLINAVREKFHAPPLKCEAKLRKAAFSHAQNMAAQNYLAHMDKQGRDSGDRIAAAGYGFNHCTRENIGSQESTFLSVLAAWQNSPDHMKNMLSPEVCEAGVGHSYSASSEHKDYWVLDLGGREKVCPLIINNEEPDTKNPLVHLYIYGAKWAKQMRFSNDKTNWSNWEPYAPAREWKLAEGSGERAVYVELKNEDDATRSDSDTIYLLPLTDLSQK